MKAALGVAGVVLVAIVGVLGWLGALGSVTVIEREMGPYQFVYVQEASADADTVAELTRVLGERLEAAGFTQRRPAQEYYPSGRGIQNQIGFMVDRTVGLDVLGTETFARTLAPQRYMVVSFPYRNALSLRVGQLRAGPALRAHRAQQKYAETSILVIHEGERLLYLESISPA